MATNKTPGSDGFTVEYYEKCGSLNSKGLVGSFNHAFNKGIMSVLQRQGIIKLIPKPNKCNWRPIDLINVDANNSLNVLQNI